MENKTHYRKVFDSPYLSAADIVAPTVLTIARVAQEKDKTKKTGDIFNTAFFAQKEIRPGEELKPMILNATNSRTMKALTGSPFIEDWRDVHVTVYVDNNIKFRSDVVDGLRISTERPRMEKPQLTPEHPKWINAVQRYAKDKTFEAIEKSMTISDENKELIKAEAEKMEASNG
jgi:hypothetical protein